MNCLKGTPQADRTLTHPVCRSFKQPLIINGKLYRKVTLSPTPVISKNPASDNIVLSPVTPYLQFSGFSPRALKAIEQGLEENNLLPMGGNVSASRKISVPPLVPGSAVGVQLMTGDLDISGTGTLTYREGNQFLAFGHTFLNGGSENFPMTAAYIEGVFPSYDRSFKLASQIKQIGTLRYDGLWAVAGNFHQQAEMIGAKIKLIDEKQTKTFNLKVIQHPNYTPKLLSFALMEALDQFSINLQNKTATVNFEIEAQGLPKVSYRNLETGNGDLDYKSILNLFNVLDSLSNNKFSALKFKNLNITLNLKPGRNSAGLTKIWVNEPTIKPGNTIKLTAVIKTYTGEEQTLTQEIPIPKNIDKGKIIIGACGGSQAEDFFSKMGQKKPQISNLTQLIKELETSEKNNQLVVKVILPRSALRIAQTDFPLLPKSLTDMFNDSPDSDIETLPETLSYQIATNYYIEGDKTLFVSVDEGSGNPTAAPESPGSQQVMKTDNHPGKKLLAIADWTLKPQSMSDPAQTQTAMETSQPAITHEPGFKNINQFNDFLNGELENCGLTLEGKIFLANESKNLYPAKAGTCWNLAYQEVGSSLYAALGNQGEIYQMDENSRPSLFCRLPEVIVSALTPDPSGGLWAGTSPNCGFYHIDEGGTFAQLPLKYKAGYLWDILYDNEKKDLYLATGNPGKILQLTTGGNSQSLIPDAYQFLHIRKILKTPDSQSLIFLAMEPNGIFQLKQGSVSPIWQGETEISDMCIDDKSRLWAACEDKVLSVAGTDYQEITVYDLPEKIYSLSSTPDGNIYLGTQKNGRIYRIDPDGNIALVKTQKSLGLIKLINRENDIYAGFTLPANIQKLSPSPALKGSFTTPPITGQAPLIWSKIRSLLETPNDSKITYQTQTSDITVSPSWSAEKTLGEENLLTLKPSQILQLKLNLYAGKDQATPIINTLEIFSGENPQPPQVKLISPAGGEKWSGMKDLLWQLTSPGVPAFTFTLASSPAQDENWTIIETSLSPIPGDDGSYKYSWDTSALTDGIYSINLGVYPANDKIKTSPIEFVSKPFYICNTQPEIKINSTELKDEQIVVKGAASSPLVNISEITTRINEGEWQKVICDDLIFDSKQEGFTILMPNQKCRMEIQVKDEAGNIQNIKKDIAEQRKG